MTAIAFGCPSAVSRVPSSGSTATSTSGPVPSPTSSPLKSIGASSFSPSPITTTPAIAAVSSMIRIASTAAWSAAFLSPRPIQRPAAIAADSVTRTSSSATFRSGALSGGLCTGKAVRSTVSPTRQSYAVLQRIYIRSGASTPTRSRERSSTFFAAVTSASRNPSCSLSSTRWWW